VSVREKANARRQPSERVKQLTNARRLRASASDPYFTYGPPELCAWRVVPGVFWIQTTEPQFSRKLEKRKDARRVEITGVNHFRRTFELRGTWRKIQKIIDRYLVSANSRFSHLNASLSRRRSPGVSREGVNAKRSLGAFNK
jgi:hypothetical protein